MINREHLIQGSHKRQAKFTHSNRIQKTTASANERNEPTLELIGLVDFNSFSKCFEASFLESKNCVGGGLFLPCFLFA